MAKRSNAARLRRWRCPQCGRVLECIGEEVRCRCGGWMELVGVEREYLYETRWQGETSAEHSYTVVMTRVMD